MEFKIKISKETFEKLKEALDMMDCNFDTPEEYINECFFLNDRHGEVCDVRDEVLVEKIGDEK